MQRIRSLLVLAALCAATPLLIAHSVWIEPLDGAMVLRFGELDGNLEKSPGHLDELSPPSAFVVVTNAPVVVEASKKRDHFLLAGAAGTNAICAEAPYAVMAAPGKPGRKPIFYARWQPPGTVAATPSLTLDLVPTGKPGEVRVYFRGQPLGGIKAVLRTPDEKERELTADADGLVRFTSSQSGQHHLSIARHRESVAGFHGGKAYDMTSHNAALTWRQP